MTKPQVHLEGGELKEATNPSFLLGNADDEKPESYVNLEDFLQTGEALGYPELQAKIAFHEIVDQIAHTEKDASLLRVNHNLQLRAGILLATQAVNSAYWDRRHALFYKDDYPYLARHIKVTEALLVEHDSLER